MAFADALDLRTAVVEAVGDPTIVDAWDRLVKLAESKLNRRLRTRFQLVTLTGVPVGSDIMLPADFLEMAGLYQGGRKLAWAPGYRLTPGSYDIVYYAALPTLSGDLTASNWLLESYPDVYLYALATEASLHMRDAAQGQVYGGMTDAALRSVYVDDERARYGGTVLRVAGATP